MTHWLRRGADGWRLDAAYAVPDRFWAQVLPRVRERVPRRVVRRRGHPRRLLGARARVPAFDSVTQYELWKAIWSSLNDGNFHELDYALVRHNEFLDDFVPMTFIGNHDVTRIASQLENTRHLEHALVDPAHHRRHPERVRRRRVGLPRRQGGAVRRRRRRAARIHRSPDGCRRTRPRHLPAAPVPDRSAQATPVAAHRADIAAAADQHASTSTGRASATTRCWSRSTSTMRRCRCRCPNSASAAARIVAGRARRRRTSSTQAEIEPHGWLIIAPA